MSGADVLSRSSCRGRRVALRPAARLRRRLRAAADAGAAAVPVRRGPGQAESLADVPWFQVFDDPTLQALIREAIANNLDLRVGGRTRRGGARPRRHREVVPLSAGRRRRQTTGARRRRTARTERGRRRRHAHQSGTYGFQLSWELDLFGRIRREHEAALALVLASEQGRRGVLVTLIGDVASNYFLLRELDLQLEIARRTLRLNDETVTYFQNRLDGGVSNRLELDRIRANRARDRGRDPRDRAADRHRRERDLAAARPSAGTDRARARCGIERSSCRRRFRRACRRRCSSGGPTSLQAEQLLVAANADIGVAKALFFPTISLTGFLGGVSGDLATFLGGDGAVWSVGRRPVPADLSGRPAAPEPRSRRRRASTRRWPTTRRRRSTATARSPTRSSRSRSWPKCVSSGRPESPRCVDASDLSRARYDSGLASYIEILTADQDLFEQQLRLAQTRGAELRARAELYRTLGGGWQPSPEAAADLWQRS